MTQKPVLREEVPSSRRLKSLQTRPKAVLGVHMAIVSGLFVIAMTRTGVLACGAFGDYTRPQWSGIKRAHPRWAVSPHVR
jgi:hypothetical protein